MKESFVFELGCEELPAGHCQSILTQLSTEVIESSATKRNLVFTRPRLFITPRRITLIADHVEPIQKILDVKGPIYDAAYENGKPNPIAVKFAQSHGTTPDKLAIKVLDGKKFLFVSKNLAADFIPNLQTFFNDLLKSVVIERPMAWDASGIKFSRPIRWILCLHGRRIIPIEIGFVHSGNSTYGPRFFGSKQLKISHAGTYEDILAKNHVIVDHRKRHILIEQILSSLKQAQHLMCPFQCAELVNEVTFLVEYPHPMICHFSNQFLSLPDKVISTVLHKHQRYFPLYNESQKTMSNMFLVIANYDKDSPLIAQGNEIVVNSRLRDAIFFFEQDMMTSLKEMADKTVSIMFQENLGSMHEKTKRISFIAEKIAKAIKYESKTLSLAAAFAKADLASALVAEFPSLEGAMGRIYAENENLDVSVSKAIEEHYLPRTAQDNLPTSKGGLVLALADRIDTLYSLFGINAIPKGNSDPYGLRRAAIGIIRILWEKDLSVTITELIDFAALASQQKADPETLTNFILQRVEQNTKDSGYRHIPDNTNLLRSVVFNSDMSIHQKKKILADLSKKSNSKSLEEVLELTKRIYNISVKNTALPPVQIKNSVLNRSEKDLFDAITTLQNQEHLSISNLGTLIKPGTAFFKENMVMSKIVAEKNRRLSILKLAHAQISRVINVKYIFG